MILCPVCGSPQHTIWFQKKRTFLRCESCTLVFEPRAEVIAPDLEKARYDTHNNSDDGYLKYIESIASEIQPHIKGDEQGLDFGCGISKPMERFFAVKSYDLYFYPEHDLLGKEYDFVIMSEVIEHMRDPRELLHLKAPKFFIKTKFLPEAKDDFVNWYYKNDKTHIQFFNERSLKVFGEIEKIGTDLYLLWR